MHKLYQISSASSIKIETYWNVNKDAKKVILEYSALK